MIKELLEIYISGAKVGSMTFGGGYAMLPILQKEVVEKKKWNTEAEILDYYALAQCLPGIIMANTLAFIGHQRKGRLGGLAASLGAITPSLIIIIIIASLLTAFADVPAVQHAFAGIRVCVCVLIFNSVLKLWKSSVIDALTGIVFVAVALGSLLFSVTPIAFVVVAAVIGIAATALGKKGALDSATNDPVKSAANDPAKSEEGKEGENK